MTGIRKRSNDPRVDQENIAKAKRVDRAGLAASLKDAEVFGETGYGTSRGVPLSAKAKRLIKERDALYRQRDYERDKPTRTQSLRANLKRKGYK